MAKESKARTPNRGAPLADHPDVRTFLDRFDAEIRELVIPERERDDPPTAFETVVDRSRLVEARREAVLDFASTFNGSPEWYATGAKYLRALADQVEWLGKMRTREDVRQVAPPKRRRGRKPTYRATRELLLAIYLRYHCDPRWSHGNIEKLLREFARQRGVPDDEPIHVATEYQKRKYDDLKRRDRPFEFVEPDVRRHLLTGMLAPEFECERILDMIYGRENPSESADDIDDDDIDGDTD